MCVCLHGFMCVMFLLYLMRPVEGDGPSRTEVMGSCSLPDVNAGNQTQVFRKSSKHI